MSIANTVIQLKKSGVSGNVPSSLNYGELGLNYADGILYYKNPAGTIKSISSSSSANSFATINANSSLILATSNTDTLSFTGTNGINITACTTTKTIIIDSSIDLSVANSKVQTWYQNTSPSAPNANDFWLANTGVLYENFGNTSYPVWAEVGPTGLLSNTQPGIISGTSANISGSLVVGNVASVTYTPASTTGTAVTISAANTRGGTGYADVLELTNISGGATNPNKFIRVDSSGNFQIINSGYTATVLQVSDAGMISTGGSSSSANNIPTGNAISLNNNGYISDDGNFHITSASGSIWINPVDSSAVRIGTQYNSGSGAGLIVQGGITTNTTDPSQGTYFTKVQSSWNVNQPQLAMDNLNVRLYNNGGNSLLIQGSAVSGSFTAYITTFENVAGQSLTGQTNSGGITFTAGTWTSINAVHTLSSGGDVIFFYVMDTTNGKIYRVTTMHTNGSTNGSIFIERMV